MQLIICEMLPIYSHAMKGSLNCDGDWRLRNILEMPEKLSVLGRPPERGFFVITLTQIEGQKAQAITIEPLCPF